MAYLLNDSRIFGLDLNPFDVYQLSVGDGLCKDKFLPFRWLLGPDPKTAKTFGEAFLRNNHQRHILRKYTPNTMYTQYAASVGNLGCLQYLKEHGYKWDTVEKAAANGHLECLDRKRSTARLSLWLTVP